MARTTLATTNARLDSVEAKLDRLIAALETKAPAKKVTRKAPVVTSGHTFTGERVSNGTRKLTKGNRKAFIAAHGWAKPGMSTSMLRNAVAQGSKVNKGWNVAI